MSDINKSSFWGKLKEAGSLAMDAAGDAVDNAKEATVGAYEGAVAKVNGAKIITDGVKEVHLTESQINNMKSYIDGDMANEKFELILDDTATDDGYERLRITIATEVAGDQ